MAAPRCEAEADSKRMLVSATGTQVENACGQAPVLCIRAAMNLLLSDQWGGRCVALMALTLCLEGKLCLLYRLTHLCRQCSWRCSLVAAMLALRRYMIVAGTVVL